MKRTTTRRIRPLDWGTIIRLEEAIYRASALTALVVSKYAASLDEDSPSQSRVLAGIITLEGEIFANLAETFDQVTSYARQLKQG
jgi:hypothetical protein